jgi:hypothetical protein
VAEDEEVRDEKVILNKKETLARGELGLRLFL